MKRLSTLLKKRLWHRCFPVNAGKFLRTAFIARTPPVAASVIYDNTALTRHKERRVLLSVQTVF